MYMYIEHMYIMLTINSGYYVIGCVVVVVVVVVVISRKIAISRGIGT